MRSWFDILSRMLRESRHAQAVDAAQLEDRVMLSASPLAAVPLELDSTTDGVDVPQAVAVSHSAEVPSVAIALQDTAHDGSIWDNQASQIRRLELIFVDTSVADYQQLLDDLVGDRGSDRRLEVHTLDGDRDGVRQISEVLAQHDELDAIHFVSHGTDREVRLGNTWLSSENLQGYAGEIAGWNDGLRAGGDLLFYGCNLAGSADGRLLLESLGELCGCDVAASSDDTGHSQWGGDWELEFATGSIEAQAPFSTGLQQEWLGLLAYHTYRDAFDSASYSNSDGTLDWTGDTWREVGEADGEGAGQIQVTNHLGVLALRIEENSLGAFREVDLSGNESAILDFKYARSGMDSGDSVVLEFSTDGGTEWSEIDRFTGGADDADWVFASYDISSFINDDSRFRFVANSMTDVDDHFFVDDVQIATSSAFSSVSEFLVNAAPPPLANVQETSGENRGSIAAVAAAANGDYVVVWTDVESTGDLSDVYARRFGSDGTPKDVPFRVNQTSAGEQQWATGASDATGRFVVAWTSEGQDGSGHGVYLRRFNPDGSAIDAADVLVNWEATTDGQMNPSVAVNATGQMVIAWQGDAANDGIYAKQFDMTTAAAGNQVPTTQFTVDTGTRRDNPAVDINSEGKFVIAWERDHEPHAQRYAADGSPRGGQIDIDPIISITTEQQSAIVVQESGDFMVAYRTEVLGSQGVYLWHYRDDGTSYALATKVSSGLSHLAPSVAKDAAGNVTVIYEGDGDGDGKGIFARQYDASRTALGQAFQVNVTAAGEQSQASVAALDTNNFVAVWSGSGPGDTDGVFARQFSTPPEALLVSTDGDVTGSLAPGLSAWDEHDVVQIADPNFSLGAGADTDGTFSIGFRLDDFGTANDINGIHYVRNTLTVGSGGGADEFTLREGDLLLTFKGGGSHTYTGNTTNVTVEESDVFVFRPQAPGDYSGGEFYYVLDDPIGNHIRGVALVESPFGVNVGDGPTLAQGTFLLSEQGGSDHDNVYTYVAATVGDGNTTSGAGKEVLIDGENGDLSFTDQIQGIYIAESDFNLGGVDLEEGDLLLTLNQDEADVGSNLLPVEQHDIFRVRMTQTEQGPGTVSIGTAAIVFDGSQVALASNEEDLDALTFTVGPLSNSSSNTTPLATNLSQSQPYTEGASSVAFDDIVVTDPDVGDTITARLTLNDPAVGALTTGTFGSLTSNYVAGTGVWQAVGSVTDVNAALADVALVPATDNDVSTSVTTHIEDGAGSGPADGTITLTATPQNDPPQATNLTQAKVYVEGSSSVDLDDIVVTELDTSPTQTITATLTLNSTAAGTLTAGSGNGETYTVGTGIWTVTGTVAQVNTALAAVAFTPAANNDIDTTITTHIEDQDAAGPADGLITLDVTPQNDPPSATNLSQTKNYTEGAASVALDDIVVSDADTDPAQTITATLTLNNSAAGALTAGSGNGETYTAGTGIWTVTGTIGQVNSALAAVTFIPTTNNDVDTTVTTQIEDQDAAGPADGVITLDVTPQNDNPQATNLDQTRNYTEGAASVALDDIVVSEVDTDPAQTITATLTLNNTATGVLTTGTFGTVTSTYTAGTGVWAAVGNLGDVNAALANVAFIPNTDNDIDTTITSRVEDQGSGGPPDGTISLDVTPQNDSPQATNLNQTQNYTEGALSVALDDIVVSEVDTDPTQTITATLTLNNTAAGTLTAGSGNGETYAAGTGVWTVTGTAGQVNTALAAVAFTPATDNDVDTTITTHIEDQDAAGPADGVITLDVTQQNDSPQATNLNQTQNYTEGAPSVALDDIVVSDVDTDPTQTITATLTLSNLSTGALTAGSGNGETYTAGTGVWTITGTVGQVNSALAAVTFIPTTDNDVDTTVSTHIEDQDATGPTDGVITLDVSPQNDNPQATNLDQTRNYIEGAASVALDDIVVSDVDTDPTQTITATLTLNNTLTGALTTGTFGAVTSTYTAGTGVWAAVGNLADVNAALANVAFIPTTDNDVDTTITSRIEDQDSGGPPDGTISLDVTPQNDGPSLDLDSDDSSGVTGANYSATFTEGGGPVGITDPLDAVVADIDSTSLTSLTVTIVNPLDGASELLAANTTGTSIVATYGANVLSLTGTDSVGKYTQVLRSITYDNVASDPATSPRQIQFVAHDGADLSNLAQTNVSIVTTNQPIGAISDTDLATNQVAENSPLGTTVGITVAATDPDGVDTVSYSLDDSAGGRFAINSTTGVVTVANPALLDFEVGTGHSITARATSSDGSFSTTGFLVSVLPVNDNFPIFSSPNAVIVNEGSNLAVTLTAADADLPSQTIAFSIIGGDDAGRFFLAGGANLSFVVPPDFELPADADADNVYHVRVSADDGNGGVTNQAIAITVSNVNEDPVIAAPSNAAIAENTVFVTTVASTDVDGGSPTYSISGGADAGRFTINPTTGVLRFTTAPNFETPLDANNDNVYDVMVRVDDGLGGDDEQLIAVTVTDANDAPVADNELYVVDGGSVLTDSAPGVLLGDMDEDGDTLTVTLVAGPTSGTLVLNADGAFGFVPANDFSGLVVFVYRVDDGRGGFDTATVTIQVRPLVGAVPPSAPPPAAPTPPEPPPPPEENDSPPETPVVTAPPNTGPPAPPAQAAPTASDGDQGADDHVGAAIVKPFTPQVSEAHSFESLVGFNNSLVSQTGNAIRRAVRQALGPAGLASYEAYVAPFDTSLLWNDLAKLGEDLDHTSNTTIYAAGSAAGGTAALSVGYVIWTIRSGWLVTSLLAQMPAWRIVDPLVVLDYLDESEDGDDDSLESMLDEEEVNGDRGEDESRPEERETPK